MFSFFTEYPCFYGKMEMSRFLKKYGNPNLSNTQNDF
jgi:hypothetical protein